MDKGLKFDLTNSELAIVEAWAAEAKTHFDKEFSAYK
jgi:hypothetical protein